MKRIHHKVTRMLVHVVSLLALNFLASFSLWACSCGLPAPTRCQGLGQQNVIFVGTVLDIENPPNEEPKVGDTGVSRYRFRIDENFKGASSSSVDLYSSRGGADCSYHFQQGTQYLVFAYQTKPSGDLSTTICSGTRPAERAKALIPQLRAMRDRTKIASLYGELRQTQEPYGGTWNDAAEQPLANTSLRADSGSHVFTTKTDADGNYAFYGLPAGSYRFTADLPHGLEIAQIILSDPVPSLPLAAGACYEYDINALPTGRIRGRVLAPDGKPLPFAGVDLFSLQNYNGGPSGWWGYQSDGHDYFEFLHVAPGDYLVVFNNKNSLNPDAPFPRTFYSSSFESSRAQVIHLTAGEQFLTADIHVNGGRPTRSLTVIVKEEGKNSPNDLYWVSATGSEGNQPFSEQVKPGLYKIMLLRQARYTVEATGLCEHKCDDQGCGPTKHWKTPAIEVDGADERASEVTLVIPANRCTQ